MNAPSAAPAQVAGLALLSLALLALPLLEHPALPLAWDEALGAVAYVWSVWLLARNQPLGWWVGLVGVTAYAWVFYQVGLYGEVGLQGFYFVTSLQAIWIWLRSGPEQSERPVGRVPLRWLLLTAVAVVLATLGLRELLLVARGAAPFWDALSTVLSVTAHLYLMARTVESWWLWIGVDLIYVPLYASRELYLTSGLYAVFLVLAVGGLLRFRALLAAQEQAQP